MIINTTTALASSQHTVSNTAIALSAFPDISEGDVLEAEVAKIFVNTNSIRVRWDSVAPTTTAGALVGSYIEIKGNDNIRNISIVRNASADSQVFVCLEA